MLDLVDRIPEIFDEPFADSSAIPTYLVSQAARRGVTVALSGDGGDELFFGYPRYRYDADAQWVFRLPPAALALAANVAQRVPVRRVRRISDVLGGDADDAYSRFVALFSNEQIAQIAGGSPQSAPFFSEMLERSRHVPRAARSGLLDLVSYLPDDILTKVDRASMAVGLEVRAPLLDHRVVEFALGLPMSLKRRGGKTKWLLRKLLYKRVPSTLVDRPKMGFGVPLGAWFRGPLRPHMNELMDRSDLRDMGLNPAPMKALWSDFERGVPARADLLWQTFVLASWARQARAARTAA